MIIKNYILYFSKKKINNNNCKKCNVCIILCPKKYIVNVKRYYIKICKLCNYCNIYCTSRCIK